LSADNLLDRGLSSESTIAGPRRVPALRPIPRTLTVVRILGRGARIPSKETSQALIPATAACPRRKQEVSEAAAWYRRLRRRRRRRRHIYRLRSGSCTHFKAHVRSPPENKLVMAALLLILKSAEMVYRIHDGGQPPSLAKIFPCSRYRRFLSRGCSMCISFKTKCVASVLSSQAPTVAAAS
jgi:hypothetical protein